ncbi:hypothetical protein JK635_07485 [Neobacillus sp. YIM B02564]|uniref:Uncharacterized protein n=1 Tax=Neobacillus paridis TaxID=2803862 RepID=A0ABS1TL61_9BACI|nr:hypothetical protein [Neobacillus paridis]MBL4952051.1 hypothetical protein [Neobacillus paridis]
MQFEFHTKDRIVCSFLNIKDMRVQYMPQIENLKDLISIIGEGKVSFEFHKTHIEKVTRVPLTTDEIHWRKADWEFVLKDGS